MVLTAGWHATLTLLLLTGCYYCLPESAPWNDGTSLVRFVIALLLIFAFLVLLRAEIRLVRRRYPRRIARVQLLLMVFYVLVLSFATTYFFIAINVSNQFAGIANRTDALYFTVTTLATVGFGDVHATGTFARALVTVQMVFDLVYLGTAVRLLGVIQIDRRAPGS